MAREQILRLVLTFNIPVSLALGIAIISPYINPNTWAFPAFFGLTFPIWFLLNLGFLIFWLAIWHKYIFFSLAVFLPGTPYLGNYMQFNDVSPPAPGTEVKVMSFNVRVFDLYNWSDNTKTRDRIVGFLGEEKPEILCLQEFFNSNDKTYFNTLDTLQQTLGLGNSFEKYTKVLHDGKHQFGIATLTSYPIIGHGVYEFPNNTNNVGIHTDIVINKDTIRVFNVHLASVYLSGLETKISEHIEKDQQTEQFKDAMNVFGRLKEAFLARAAQADEIAAAIAESPFPVILAGDFNDTPVSYAYRSLAENLEDAYKMKGRSLGNTYNGFFPSMRIDYILNDPRLEVTHFETKRVELSDHFPIVAWFRVGEG